MKLADVVKLVDGEIVVGDGDVEIERVEASDLMSDVLAFFEEGTLLITSLTSPQVVRTAVIVGIPAIIFTRGKPIPEEVIEMSRENGVTVVKTNLSTFETCGRIYGGMP